MLDKRRLLYVGGFQLPDKNAAAYRVLGIAKVFELLNYEVVFLDINEEIQDCQLKKSILGDHYTVYSQGKPRGMKEWVKYTVSPLHVEEVLTKYKSWDGIIAYNYPAVALHKLKKICKKYNIKLYSDCTEWYDYGFPHSIRDVIVKLDTFLRMRIVQKNVDGIIAISSYLYRYYRRHTNTVIIPPVVDITDEKWINKKSSNSKLKLAYVGSPGKTKDKLDVIVRAVSECKYENVKLYIAGITKEEYLVYNSYKNIDSQKVEFLGKLSHEKALQVVKDSDYTIFFRKVSKVSLAGFPTKFVESISCGVPVITNNTSDLSNYIKEDKNGYMLSTEHFEQDLKELLGQLIAKKKAVCMVEKEKFDYRCYREAMKLWLDSTMQ